ncbi:hypothetical protein J437_LFUL016160 [Ladona fulva]|uniref:SEA domain-containing protein n=1 Tax=Ladona fulva TaxID=123851 RepID=A0A8K0P9G2_LADFU|nr:hypothetical protein J437_LFUL016160 [Ladona fulva]
MSSSSGGSESTASMREGATELTPNMDPNASMAEEEQSTVPPAEMQEEPKEAEEATESAPEVQSQIQQSPDNRMASVITINGVEASQDVTFVEMNSGMSGGRSERSAFDNPGFVDDEAHGKVGTSGTKVVNGGGRLSPPSSPPPRPPSPAGPFLNSVVSTPPPSGANGRGPVMETPNSNVHNSSGLIMTPNDKEKSEIDGCTNVTEAVNLELVNMNPYGGAGLGVGDDVAGKSGTNGGLNGIPVKRGDEETGDGGFGDPYDEYFVPVNEHRKYIRGEKLYVTKDRRKSQSWKRCICWGVGFTVLAIAILIAVLAGTGVILSQEEEGKAVESRGFSNNAPHVAESRDPNAPVEKEPPIPTEGPPEPSSSFTPPPSMSSVPVYPPTTEMSSLYVPRVLEGEMKIDNLDFTHDLENSSSTYYMDLARVLKEELMHAVFNGQNTPADLFVKVVEFRPGSVVVKFHVGWRLRDSNDQDPVTMDSLQDQLKKHLLNNAGYLYTYHVEPETVKSNRK